ncbi:MAG: hypothetical protein WD027_00950 [Gaiellales bacterium]
MSVRTIVSVIGIAAVFGAVVLYGGSYVGAWDPVEPRPPGPAAAEEDDDATTTAKAPTTTAKSQEPAPTPAPAPDSRWLAQANALCRRSAEEVAALPEPTTQKEARTVLAQAVDLNAFYNDEFAALGAPPGGAVAFAELLGLFEREEKLLRRMLTALQENKMNEYFRLSDRVIPLTLEEDDVLYELGAENCTVSLVPELSF